MRRSLSNTGCGHEGRSPSSASDQGIRGLQSQRGYEQRGSRSSSLGWIDSHKIAVGRKDGLRVWPCIQVAVDKDYLLPVDLSVLLLCETAVGSSPAQSKPTAMLLTASLTR